MLIRLAVLNQSHARRACETLSIGYSRNYIYNVVRKNVSLYFGPELPCFTADFYNSFTIGNKNECSIEELQQLHLQLCLHTN